MDTPKGKGAWMAKVGEKGQIVIPKDAREMFGIRPGDTLMLLGDIHQGLAIINGDKMIQIAEQLFGKHKPDTEGRTKHAGHTGDEPHQEV